MKVYYLLNIDLGWDNLVCIGTSRMKCIEAYTNGDVIPQNDKEVDEFLEKNKRLYMDYKFLNE